MITRRSKRHAASSFQLGICMERERVLSLMDTSVEMYGDDILTVLNALLFHIGNAPTVESMYAHQAMHGRGLTTIN